MDRRGFLRTGAAASAALLAGGRLAHAAPQGPAVVIVRDKAKKAIADHTVDAAIVQKLVDKAVMSLADKDDVAKAWGTLVAPKDKVAVKFNGLFARATTHPEIVDAVTNGLMKAGIDPANIVVYDRDARAFKTARIAINREGARPRAYPTVRDYGPKVKAGPHSTQITNILANADVLINLPIIKTHSLAGISGALKNHLGTIPNASTLHTDDKQGKSCLFVADLNALEPIKAKTRICICDALYGLYHGGPRFNARFRWDLHSIIASLDPVALDTTLADIIKAKRVEKGMSPYQKPIRHITRAAELGLGQGDLAKINRLEIEI
jgi:uncharacterized protein (DUF362 family)